MKTLDELAAVSRERGIRLTASAEGMRRSMTTSALTLFYEPLLSMVVLIIAEHQKGRLRTGEVSVWSAAVLANCYFGIHTRHRMILEWAPSFRERCAGALAILETLAFVEIDTENRTVNASPKGTARLRELRTLTDESGLLTRRLVQCTREAFRLGLGLL